MPFTVVDGVTTHFEMVGSGPPLLMFSPGGFDASLDKWSSAGKYREIGIVERLKEQYTCILFDRRESGQSGGRIERLTWRHYVDQAKGLLGHLGVDKVHLIGGCMGCPPVATFGVEYPDSVMSMVLFWPVGGPHYRVLTQSRFSQHIAYVIQAGLDGVVKLATGGTENFSRDPRVGLWANMIRRDSEFASMFAAQEPDDYRLVVQGIANTLVDRDTAPGPEPEDLMSLRIPTLIVPGRDRSHAASAAAYLAECLPNSEYWDVVPEQQSVRNTPDKILAFLAAHGVERVGNS